MESIETIPYLLAIDCLGDGIIKKFNILKQKQDPAFVPFKYSCEISYRPELRADKLWSKLVPIQSKDTCSSTPRYVMVPIEMVPYVVVDEYDGSERYHINYNQYGIKKIQEILGNTNDTDKLSAIQSVIDKVVLNPNK